ncbi:nuclear transport factor 2 family protein [Streptomyces sp. TRM 70361]|uniref:nuclear transport factor 2 family protein n=1 Tax=Streptomyces sp. TRM 70361 TaxID=3116553 RepID=UPI002E7BCD77|nr:nuclear transport factor 2 family protein [Streptomyces sp. TRM 70361]MEE1940793.1 nuclear transport factor 2 family protein [Streptomyces sp. TRM 70361]
MRPRVGTDPKRFIADFYTSFTEELLRSDEDAALIVDRYHTPDVIQVADGHRIDRDKLIAHTRPVRKNRPGSRMEVHEALADGDRIAARYTLHVRQRGKDLVIEVCFFGRFTEDGRMREAHLLIRTAPTAGPGQPTPDAPDGKNTPGDPATGT